MEDPGDIALLAQNSGAVMDLMAWALGLLIASVLALIVYIWKTTQSSIVSALGKISVELHAIRQDMSAIKKWFQRENRDLDIRLTRLESRHDYEDNEALHDRRKTDSNLANPPKDYEQ